MKRSTFFSILAASVVVILAIGGAGFYWLIANSPLNLLQSGGQNQQPTAAMFISKQAPVMVSLLVNPDRLQALGQVVASPENADKIRDRLDRLQENLLANTDLDYKQDIAPWLGDEITLAITNVDIDRDRKTGQKPGYLIVLATRNSQLSKQFLDDFWRKKAVAGEKLIFESYQGAKLIYANSDANLVSAAVGDRFLLFANDPKVLRDAINNVQAPALSLKNSPSYQQALQSLHGGQLGFIFFNIPSLTNWISGNSAVVNSNLSAPQIYDSLVTTLGLQPQGILAQTAWLVTPGSEIPAVAPTLSHPVGALQYLPAQTSLAIGGNNLYQLTESMAGKLGKNTVVSAAINQTLNNLKNRWGIDLAKDIFVWVKDEYALGLLPPNPTAENPANSNSNSDWIFVAKKSNDKAAIEHLDKLALQAGLSIGPLKLGNQQVSAWTNLSTATAAGDANSLIIKADVKGVRTTVGDYEIFTTSIEAMDEALQAGENSLLNNSRFQGAIAPLPKLNDGYVYLDWQTVEPLLRRQFPFLKFVEIVGKPLFDNLQSISISSQGSQATIRNTSAFLKLAVAKDK